MSAEDGRPRKTKTVCPYCGVGCGIIASVGLRKQITITGDPAHPANFGRLCPKGIALVDTLGLEGRLLNPMQRMSNGMFEPLSWDNALNIVSMRLSKIIETNGPDAIAFYLSGQLLTEDYYVANKLMKGFIGSANIDTNSRLCMASTVAAHIRVFGSDTVPASYEDLDAADLIVLVGSNAAWCHPVLFWRILKNRERGAKLVVIDTRKTATVESADLFLQIAPGGDQALFCGLLVYLAETDALDHQYIKNHTNNFEDVLAASRQIAATTEAAAIEAGVSPDLISAFYKLFKKTERVVTVFSQGVNQSSQGVDKVISILNCHLATGRIGKAGASPFSFTGQPNAMGGREVGGLANLLAAHMSFDEASIDRVRRFWNAPNMATQSGLKAADMFGAIADGKIKALWVSGTNPAASMSNAQAVREALSRLDLLIVSENVASNDTINCGAHILLPTLAWGEKNGTVTNSERCISRQRSFLPAPEGARADWSIFADVACRMGFDGFGFRSPADIFDEHARLSAFENCGQRDFDIGGLTDLTAEGYDSMQPMQWPIRVGEPGETRRLFADGAFFSPTGRADFIAPELPKLATQTSAVFPLRLNTGRVRDQWHTMTRTGKSPRLARHALEPYVDVSIDDAIKSGIEDGGFARVTTKFGVGIFRARVTENQATGSIFVPIHWTDANSSHASVGMLTAPFVDPISGQPEFKATPTRIEPVTFKWHGFLHVRRAFESLNDVWWALIAADGRVIYSVAGSQNQDSWLHSLQGKLAEGDFLNFTKTILNSSIHDSNI
jgi:assimilatory nitrate reductase catalytic subunit